VVTATLVDLEAIIGDECHIVSAQEQGPRYDPSFPPQLLDSYENLLLLCKVHHKMVDDQCKTYDQNTLVTIKATHEDWVDSNLKNTKSNQPGIFQIKENVPTMLTRLTAGRDIFNLASGSCASSFDHEELSSKDEVDLIGSFLSNVQDWADIGPDLEPHERVKATFSLSENLREIEQLGFWVFGAREIQALKDSKGQQEDWPILILQIVRQNNPSIIKISN